MATFCVLSWDFSLKSNSGVINITGREVFIGLLSKSPSWKIQHLVMDIQQDKTKGV